MKWICFLLSIEKELLNKIDYNNLMINFASKKSLKSKILNKNITFVKQTLIIFWISP